APWRAIVTVMPLSVVADMTAMPLSSAGSYLPGAISKASACHAGFTGADTVFRKVITALLAGAAVTFLYCDSGSVGDESAAMIGGLIWMLPVPPAPVRIAVMRNVLRVPVS